MAGALYIHWPFCLAKCPYCDFNSHVRDKVDHAAWETALLADLRHEAELCADEPLGSIFFGGGTPSLMPPAMVARLLQEAERLWKFSETIEITLEGNPSSIETARYRDLADAGINRASLGIQALDDLALRFLGRLHTADEGLRALATAQAQFARVSIDLIYARPGQTLADWSAELDRAIALGTTHLSLYQLTIEPGTRFESLARQGDLIPLSEDRCADMFTYTRGRTAAAGLPAYEVSNHAQSGQESRHNLAYWRYHDYAGIGPGAHGRRGGIATVRHRKPENWLGAVARQGHGIAEQVNLVPAEQAAEALLMGLRLAEGIDPAALARRFGLRRDNLIDPSKFGHFLNQGLVWQTGERIGVSDAGTLVLNALLADLIPAELVTA